VVDAVHKVNRRTNVLGVGVSAIDMSQAVERMLDARAKRQAGYVCVTGVHGVIESQRDPELKKIHNQSFLTVPDGMPTVWMGREQGFTKMGRVYGPDLMLEVFEKTEALGAGREALGESRDEALDANDGGGTLLDQTANSAFTYPSQDETGSLNIEGSGSDAESQMPSAQKCFTHFLYGATEEMLSKLKANLEKRFPGVQIVGTYAPPFRPLNENEEAELSAMVSECKPDFFWVGLSTPKQEKFMADHDPRALGAGGGASGFEHVNHPLDCGIMLGVGAAFPIHAGFQKDTPKWIQNAGLQWLHRLCMEPRRLWRRYLWIVPTFLWLAFLQVLGVRKYAIEDRGC